MTITDPFAGWEFFDISLPIGPGFPVWPGDPELTRRFVSRIAHGDSCNLTELHLSAHTGTHVDPPWHFIDDGDQLEQVPLTRWFGPCQVIEIDDETNRIGPEQLEAAGISSDTTRLLFKTTNSRKWRSLPMSFDPDFVALSPTGAQWIADHGIELVGIDYLSIEGWDEPESLTHRTLLGAGVLILEGLNLTGIEPGGYLLWCLPLRLLDADGAPARAILARPRKVK